MSRVTVTEDEFGGLRVTVGPRRHIPTAIFMTVWCCGWAVGEVLVPWGAFAGGIGKQGELPTYLVMLVWWVFWTFAGWMAIRIWWMNLFGREIMVFGGTSLELRKEVGVLVQSTLLDLDGVSNLRYSTLGPYSGGRSTAMDQFGASVGQAGSVAFDHGGKTYRFGAGLSETDSKRLILTIQKYFPIEEEPLQPFPITR